MGHFYKKKQTYTYPPKDTRTLQISKACLENQASVSVYLEKMLGGKWHVFEFHQVEDEIKSTHTLMNMLKSISFYT